MFDAITLTLPVALHGTVDTLMAAAPDAGQANGWGDGWIPSSISEAIYELVLEGSPLVSVGHEDSPHFPLHVSFVIDDQEELREGLAMVGITLINGLEVSLLAAMMLPMSPDDMGFEIDKLVGPQTSHEKAQAHLQARLAYVAKTA